MLESFEKVMNDPQRGWPTLNDFKEEQVFFDEALTHTIENKLNKTHRCLIRGAEGRGKTVLARIVAYERYKDLWKIRFIDVRDIKEEHIDRVLRQVEQAVNAGDEKILFIVENVHASLDEITPKLIELADREQRASFLFISRKILPEEGGFFKVNPFEKWEENEWYVDLRPDLSVVKGIIEKFILSKNIHYSLSGKDESWIQKEFGKRSINLRRLRWYLETWSEIGGCLYSIQKKSVLKKVLNHYLEELEGLELQEMLFKVSAVFQFDVNFYGKNFDLNLLETLTQKEIISGLPGYYYRLQHSSDAAYIIGAEAILREGKEPTTITTNILKEYLQKKPDNYSELMRALYHHSMGRDILSKIFEDQETYEAIFNMVKQDRIGRVGSVLSYLTWACGKERGLEFWSQYKRSHGDSPEEQKEKLKVKLTDAYLLEVVFLLSFLRGEDADEGDWFAMEVLDEDILVQKTKDAAFGTIETLIKLLPDNKASTIIQKLDAPDIAAKARDIKLQRMMWFLKYCLKDSSNINFARLFMSEIHKQGSLIETFKDSELGVVLGCLSTIKRIDPHIHKDIKDNLSSQDWLQIWLSSGLNVIIYQLYRYRWSIGPKKEFAQSVVNGLASKGLPEPIRRLYNQPETKPLKVLGKLLDITYQIAFESNPKAVEKIAQQIVDNIDLRTQETYTFEELSLLVKNVKKCNEEAYEDLCSKILSELNLADRVNIPFDKGLVVLMWDIYQYDNEKGHALAGKIFSLDFNELLDSSETKAISMLLWNMLQINDSKVRIWIQNIEEDKCLSKVLPSYLFSLEPGYKQRLKDGSISDTMREAFENNKVSLSRKANIIKEDDKNWKIKDGDNTYKIEDTETQLNIYLLSYSTQDVFWLLWNLYQADGERGKSLTRFLANNVLSSLTAVEVKDLPLLGFFVFCGVQFDLNISIPSPYEIAEKISEDLSVAELAFCVCLLKKKNDKLLKEFSRELGRRLFLRNSAFSIKEGTEKHPLENTRQRLMEIFKDFDLPKEPNSTFAEMICLTKTYLEEKKKREVAFGQLRDFFLSNPGDNPLFKSANDSTKWLNIAIEYGIYHTEQVPHYEDPSGVVTLLSLNKEIIGLFHRL